ncbi:MAG: ImmA/IrrE family metallo-endopeptidase, partial [Pseudomonadota bacterium]
EQFAMREGGLRDMRLAALSALGNRGWRVAFADATAPCVFDANRQTFTLSRHLSRVEQRLHLLTLTARLCFQEHLQRAARTAGSAQDADPETALEPLVRYFAIAALLPYRVFLRSAFACRYDVDSLARQFDVDADHVALRCAMLNRLGAKGLPCSYRRVSTYGATQTHLHSNAALCAASERVAISRPAGRPPIAQASSHNQIVRADDGRIVLQQMRETQADPKNKAIVVLLSDISRTQRGIKDGGKDGGASGAEQGRAQPDSASGLTARVSC